MLMKTLLGAALVMALAAGPAMAQPAPVQLKQPDQDFLTKASEGNISEIKLGQLAVEKATSSQVKAFGQRMVSDHKKAQQVLDNTMRGSSVLPPDHVSKDAADLYDKLARESGGQFDRDYMQAMVNDHQDDINVFKDEARNGRIAQLRSYAQNTLPTLHDHLKSAKEINQQVAQNEK
jgi:putative membrane protein